MQRQENACDGQICASHILCKVSDRCSQNTAVVKIENFCLESFVSDHWSNRKKLTRQACYIVTVWKLLDASPLEVTISVHESVSTWIYLILDEFYSFVDIYHDTEGWHQI